MKRLGLFEAIGVELEYMIVRGDTLDVNPCCDELMRLVTGSPESDHERGPIAWSNELALHVVELKTNGPAATLEGLDALFQDSVEEVNRLLGPMGSKLLPTAMHPWMDPHSETRLWPHEYTDIYRAYDRIFDCRGHGWSNLQSTHINLPFRDDEEFSRLHTAIRLVLPLLPALAASSPVVEGRLTGTLDNRLVFYRGNQARVPVLAGDVIPEPIRSEAEYRSRIHDRIREAITPLDTDKVLQAEFLNSRGAIARFDRGAIEIRLIDIQESPRADIAVVALVVEVVRALVEERWSPFTAQVNIPTGVLAGHLWNMAEGAGGALIDDFVYLHLFGILGQKRTARDVWKHLARDLSGRLAPWADTLDVILGEGTLSERITSHLDMGGGREAQKAVYAELAATLGRGGLFHRRAKTIN